MVYWIVGVLCDWSNDYFGFDFTSGVNCPISASHSPRAYSSVHSLQSHCHGVLIQFQSMLRLEYNSRSNRASNFNIGRARSARPI